MNECDAEDDGPQSSTLDGFPRFRLPQEYLIWTRKPRSSTTSTRNKVVCERDFHAGIRAIIFTILYVTPIRRSDKFIEMLNLPPQPRPSVVFLQPGRETAMV